MIKPPNDSILCYVSDGWAYFTTQSLEDQWGDDWNDAPYEYNAGSPYEPCWHRENGKSCDCNICKRDWNDDGTPKWAVYSVPFTGPLEEPCSSHFNSPYSVEAINRHKAAPWLESECVRIYAGTDYEQFKALIAVAGGTVFEPAPGNNGQ